jgi:nucleotide-binding universal stress UspA family protein
VAGTLIVWKAPKVPDEDAAVRLLHDYDKTGDESAFEPSKDVVRFYDDLLALWPSLEDLNADDADLPPSWSELPERSNRVVSMEYRWSAADAFLEDIERLAREHGLVLYDPQGPVVIDPDEPEPTEFVPDAREVLRVIAILLGAVAVMVGAWYASITVLSWLVIVVVGFVAVMAAFTLVHYAREALERRAS